MKKILSILATALISTSAYAIESVKVLTSDTDPNSVTSIMPYFCAKHNIKVEVTQKPSSIFNASSGGLVVLDRGDFDVVSMALGSVIIAKSQGVDINTLVGVANGGTALIGRPGLNTYESLKGHKVAILRGTHNEQLFLSEMRKRGLSVSGPNPDVNIINMANDVMPMAFDQGSVDAFIGVYPGTLEVVNSKRGVVIEDYSKVVRALYASSRLNGEREKAFLACYNDMVNAVNSPKRRNEVEAAAKQARDNGKHVVLPPNTALAYKIVPAISNEVLNDLVAYLIEAGKVRKDFVIPAEFNRSQTK